MKNKEVIDTHNTVRPLELESILRKNMKTIINDTNMSKCIPSIMIWSSPGLGKSSIVKSVANDLGIEFIDFRLSYRDPVDLHGLPTVDISNNKAMWLPFEDLPRNKEGKGIILFDELSSVDKSLQNAALQLILDRKIDKYEVPDGYMIVAAGNKVTDRAISQTMASSLSNRFLHFELSPNAEDWRLWAIKNDIHPAVIGFISFRPALLHKMEGENLERGWPSPRSWEKVSTMIKLYSDIGEHSEKIIRKIVYGLVGNGAGVEFMEFYKMNKEFDNVRELMLNSELEIIIPERADMKYALVSSMIYQLWRGNTEDEENKLLDGFYRIMNKLSVDFAAMAMTSAMIGNTEQEKKEHINKIFRNKNYNEWMKKYGKNITKRISF